MGQIGDSRVTNKWKKRYRNAVVNREDGNSLSTNLLDYYGRHKWFQSVNDADIGALKDKHIAECTAATSQKNACTKAIEAEANKIEDVAANAFNCIKENDGWLNPSNWTNHLHPGTSRKKAVACLDAKLAGDPYKNAPVDHEIYGTIRDALVRDLEDYKSGQAQDLLRPPHGYFA